VPHYGSAKASEHSVQGVSLSRLRSKSELRAKNAGDVFVEVYGSFKAVLRRLPSGEARDVSEAWLHRATSGTR
jgi:hypothetical protein